MTDSGVSVVRHALRATDAEAAHGLLAQLRELGHVHDRPVGDRWGNRALFTAAGGDYDHKLVELVTNMQDAVLLRLALVARGPHALHQPELFDGPHEAAAELLQGLDPKELRQLCRVELHDATDGDRTRTLVFRDLGSGMSPDEVVTSLFRVGSSRKDGLRWQLGAFGRGGLTTLPNASHWVVVTRKQPALLGPGEDDVVTLAVVRWEHVGHRQTRTALYPVDRQWSGEGAAALPLSVPAPLLPEFVPGTHIGVIGFESQNLGVSRLGDERSLDTLLDTRLFRAVVPVQLLTPALSDRAERTTTLRGLGRRLDANPRHDRLEGREELPVNFRGRTYRLPVSFHVFPAGDSGSRRRFVARDHSLLLLSNGQVHAHWSTADFRARTSLPKLAERVLVVVETDVLPLALRTDLFTADRTELLRSTDAVRLEQEVVAFLDDWPELREANDELVREAIRRSNVDRSTVAVAERIGRALQVSGGPLVTARRAARAAGARGRGHSPPDLHDDPLSLSGPDEVLLQPGRTIGVQLLLDAKDGFVPRRARLEVSTDHLDIDVQQDVAVGELRRGRLRVSVAVPTDADLAPSTLTFTVPAWADRGGGLSGPLSCQVALVTEDAPRPLGHTRPSRGAAAPQVAVVWTSHEGEAGWTAATAGDVEEVSGESLRELDGRYGVVGTTVLVPLIRINEEFSPLKAYATSRARAVGDEGVARAKDRYAVGVGLHLLLTHREVMRRAQAGEAVDEGTVASARADAARAVLAVLPDFDSLAQHAGVQGV